MPSELPMTGFYAPKPFLKTQKACDYANPALETIQEINSTYTPRSSLPTIPAMKITHHPLSLDPRSRSRNYYFAPLPAAHHPYDSDVTASPPPSNPSIGEYSSSGQSVTSSSSRKTPPEKYMSLSKVMQGDYRSLPMGTGSIGRGNFPREFEDAELVGSLRGMREAKKLVTDVDRLLQNT